MGCEDERGMETNVGMCPVVRLSGDGLQGSGVIVLTGYTNTLQLGYTQCPKGTFTALQSSNIKVTLDTELVSF
jgi:hypothetical protein